MRGIISAAGYVPFRRLHRTEITSVLGTGGGRGARAVASYDEDTTTMAQAACDLVLGATTLRPDSLWFATCAPAYVEKTNAAAIHAALRLDAWVDALDFGGAIRSGIGALRTALEIPGSTKLVVASDLRDGLPGGADEATCGDAAAAVLVGDEGDESIIASYLGGASSTLEVTERWRLPGGQRSRSWEDRFAPHAYGSLVTDTWHKALSNTGVKPGNIDHLIVTGLNARTVAAARKATGVDPARMVDDLVATVGNTATAHPALLLTSALESANPGDTIAVLAIADGVEVIVLRATEAISEYRPAASVASQIEEGRPMSYGRFLAWRKMITVEPPNRPPPARPSSPAALRRSGWKYGFEGSQDRSSRMVHLPPARVSEIGGAADDMDPAEMAGRVGTVASFTIDRLAYSPSPPTVFAIIDFEGGGRAALEVTDVDVSDVAIGMRVVPTFRRLYTSDEIHNYFWKVRPTRADA